MNAQTPHFEHRVGLQELRSSKNKSRTPALIRRPSRTPTPVTPSTFAYRYPRRLQLESPDRCHGRAEKLLSGIIRVKDCAVTVLGGHKFAPGGNAHILIVASLGVRILRSLEQLKDWGRESLVPRVRRRFIIYRILKFR